MLSSHEGARFQPGLLSIHAGAPFYPALLSSHDFILRYSPKASSSVAGRTAALPGAAQKTGFGEAAAAVQVKHGSPTAGGARVIFLLTFTSLFSEVNILLYSCRIMEAMLPTACLYGIETGYLSLWLDSRLAATPQQGE
ncbi:hypothetical protein JZM24_15605 [Candidatus Sodalis endolongispinus]|uniref:Uncharacterized protein n=1 Tax=Candidatus Sodalis endolongispinus TaxID=2812662 RepID=A0ABS5YFA3_9GAMM|nr:hypothetical protein [Candidatus Sodalis endolongispinus]MBT9433184.1 hypothetical protein [Candidatus Sodalis endolongispinus]